MSQLSLCAEALGKINWIQSEDCKILMFTSPKSPFFDHSNGFGEIHPLGVCISGEDINTFLYLQKLAPDEPLSHSNPRLPVSDSVFCATDDTLLLPSGTLFVVTQNSPTCLLGVSFDGVSVNVVGLTVQKNDMELTSDEVLMDCLFPKDAKKDAKKKKRITLGKVQYGSSVLMSRQASRAAIMWLEKYASDVVKIEKVGDHRRFKVYAGGKWKRVTTLTECLANTMDQTSRDFWSEMSSNPGCIDLFAYNDE